MKIKLRVSLHLFSRHINMFVSKTYEIVIVSLERRIEDLGRTINLFRIICFQYLFRNANNLWRSFYYITTIFPRKNFVYYSFDHLAMSMS